MEIFDAELALMVLVALALMTLLAAAVLIIGIVARYTRRNERELTPSRSQAAYTRGTAAQVMSSAESRMKAPQRPIHFEGRPLRLAEHHRLTAAWTNIQKGFVDDPARAVKQADDLIERLLQARDFPELDFRKEPSAPATAFVQHHLSSARALADTARDDPESTEDRRQAMRHYRELYGFLMESEEHEPTLPLHLQQAGG